MMKPSIVAPRQPHWQMICPACGWSLQYVQHSDVMPVRDICRECGQRLRRQPVGNDLVSVIVKAVQDLLPR